MCRLEVLGACGALRLEALVRVCGVICDTFLFLLVRSDVGGLGGTSDFIFVLVDILGGQEIVGIKEWARVADVPLAELKQPLH